jgi:hypothetical protein
MKLAVEPDADKFIFSMGYINGMFQGANWFHYLDLSPAVFSGAEE